MFSLLKRFQKTHLFYVFILLFAVVVTYAVAFNATFILDDKSGISENPNMGNLSVLLEHPKSIFGQLPFHLAYLVGGKSPFVFRLLNLMFHFGTVVGIYYLVKRLFNQSAGFLSALLFAIHPMLIESVTWISALSYPQYSFFAVVSLLSYIQGKEKRSWYFVSIVSAALSILSSEKGAALVPLLALVEFTFFSLKKNWKKIIPHFLVVGSYALVYLSNIGSRIESFQKDYYIQKQFYNPLEHVPYAVTYYLQLILFPRDLTVYHSELSITIVEFMFRWFIFIAIIVSLVILYKKNKAYFFGMMFFLIAIAPTLVPLNIVWVVAERYAYLATAGILIAIGVGLSALLAKKKYQTISYAAVMLLMLLLVGRSIVRNTDWLTEDSLWIATVKVSPSSSNAHNNMGDVYARRGDYVNAALEFQKAIELQPGDADPRHNLGIAYTMTKRYPEAADAYESALSIDPTLYRSHQNLGVVYYELQQYDKAIYHFEQALTLGPPNEAVVTILKEAQRLKEAQ